MTPAHNGGLSKPVTLRAIQLFFAFACLAFSVAACVFVRGSIALLIAIIGSAIAMVDASYGWHAITSKIAKKRNTILGWDYAGLLGLIAATISLVCGFTVDGDYSLAALEAPGVLSALVSMGMLVWQILWLVPATTKQKDGLLRYSEIQGRKQDVELEEV